ncbi:hypothetical protein Taro_003012 [Colocasia esculenta]|uniref:Uncharacterized protein n=1 Tax=Colocasia esculenta TaxID=4460 RepID=A0A843TKE6_COLES|nr:hypothetical protein [Colocasia esculenta]
MVDDRVNLSGWRRSWSRLRVRVVVAAGIVVVVVVAVVAFATVAATSDPVGPSVQRFGVVLVVLPRLFARCLALEGLSRSKVVSVSWDPHPREPVEGGIRATSVLEPDSPLSHCLSLRWFWSHVVVPGVRPQLGQTTVLRELVCFCGGSVSPFAGVEAGARLLHGECSLAVASSRGRHWSGLVRTGASGNFHSMFLQFCGSVPWCLSVVAPVGVVPDLVCAEHCFRFVPDSIGFCGSRPHPPYVHQLGARRRWSSVSDGLRRRLWRRVVVSNIESERCCSCCCTACVASVVARRVRAVAARSALDSLAVVFLVWRTLASQSSEVLLEFFSVGSGGSEDCSSLVSAVVVPPQSLRCAVGLAGAFWRVFPRAVPWWFWWRFSQDRLVFFPGSPFVASGGGSSQECFVFVSGHRCVAPVIRSVLFGWAAFWCCALGRASGYRVGQLVLLVISKFLGRAGGTCVSPWLEWLASFLTPGVLLQMVVCCMCYTLSVLRCFVFSCLKGWGRHGLLCPFRLAVLCAWLLVVVVPCFGLGLSEVDMLPSTSVVVLLPVWLCVAFILRECGVAMVLVARVASRLDYELLTGVFCVAVGNCVLCRVLLATEWVADRLVPTARIFWACPNFEDEIVLRGVECKTQLLGFPSGVWDDWPLTRPGWATH